MSHEMTTIDLGKRLADLWSDIEDAGTGEMAAYSIACEQLGISEEEGWSALYEAFGKEPARG